MHYEFGPDINFDIKFTGDMEKFNGNYYEQSEANQNLIQTLCHMAYQITDTVKDCGDILRMDGVWATIINNNFSLYTNDMMTVFSIWKTGKYSYDFEFFSPTQLEKSNGFFKYVSDHFNTYGRRE